LESLKGWFFDYVSGFYDNDSARNCLYQLKEDHSRRVCENSFKLGRSLHLGLEDLEILGAAALFHDIGRFRQLKEYGTFNDKKSVNHARLGVNILGTQKVLKSLSLEKRRLILIPIAFHNAYKLPAITDDKLLLFARLLRDADKLDIFRVVLEYYKDQNKDNRKTVLQDLPDREDEFSETIINAIYEGKAAQSSHLRCLTDLKLLQISWVYDLHCQESFRLLQESCFIEEIAGTLPDLRQIKNVVSAVRLHIEKMATHAFK